MIKPLYSNGHDIFCRSSRARTESAVEVQNHLRLPTLYDPPRMDGILIPRARRLLLSRPEEIEQVHRTNLFRRRVHKHSGIQTLRCRWASSSDSSDW